MADIKESFARSRIVFHNAEPSDAVRTRAQHLLAKLFQFHPSIMRCTMTVEGRHRHHHQGNLYHVSLRVHVPGADIVVSQDPERNHAHEDIYVAMRDACEAARRQLDGCVERRAGKGARHEQERFEIRKGLQSQE